MYSHNEILYCIVVPLGPSRLSRIARSWVEIRGYGKTREPEKKIRESRLGRFEIFRLQVSQIRPKEKDMVFLGNFLADPKCCFNK